MSLQINRRDSLKGLGAAGLAVITLGLDTHKSLAGVTSFQSLWDQYPLGTPEAVNKSIGGHVALNNFHNTCTIRTSHAFNYSGDPLPGPTAAAKVGMNVISGADKMWYSY